MPRISDVLANNRSATQMPGLTGAEAVRTPTFWRLAINLFLVGAAMGVAIAPIAHSSPTAGVSSGASYLRCAAIGTLLVGIGLGGRGFDRSPVVSLLGMRSFGEI
jgi:hypothetical protein